jgi:hypothetical protein
MSLEYGLVATFAIIGLGGVGLTGFVLWLRFREGEGSNLPGGQK